jgi:tetratricopeptide (TPR) repeat protein
LGNNWTEDKDGTAARARLFEEGYTFAEDNEIEEAIVRFQQALQCGKPTLISETPDEQLTPEKLEASAQRLVAPILLEQGQRLARFGNFDGALAKFEKAKQFNSDLTIDPVAEAKRLTAPILKMQGTFAALEFKLPEAIAKFTQAKQYAPDLEFDPETEAKRLAASVLVEQGKKLANLGLVPEAIDAYQTAQTYALDLEILAKDWNNLCWYGVLHGATQKNTKLVKDVLAFSQKALENSEDFRCRDTLGVAKVLTGDKRLWKSAIKDFEYYVQQTDSVERKEQSQRWINALEKGENPLTEAEIQTLLNQ